MLRRRGDLIKFSDNIVNHLYVFKCLYNITMKESCCKCFGWVGAIATSLHKRVWVGLVLKRLTDLQCKGLVLGDIATSRQCRVWDGDVRYSSLQCRGLDGLV